MTLFSDCLKFSYFYFRLRVFAGQCGTSGSSLTGAAGTDELSSPKGLAIDSANSRLYIADTGNYCVKYVTIGAGGGTNNQQAISSYIGNGSSSFSTTTFINPTRLWYDTNNLILYVADQSSVRRIPTSTGIMATYAGTGTAGTVTEDVVATSSAVTVSSISGGMHTFLLLIITSVQRTISLSS